MSFMIRHTAYARVRVGAVRPCRIAAGRPRISPGAGSRRRALDRCFEDDPENPQPLLWRLRTRARRRGPQEVPSLHRSAQAYRLGGMDDDAFLRAVETGPS